MPDPTPSAVPDPVTPSAAAPGVVGPPADPDRTSAGASADTIVAAPAFTVSAQRYELGAEIARGGMGAVYRATDTAFAREVAVKVLLDRFAPTSGTARRFHDEARITGQLQHPNIPAVFDLGTLPDGRPFLAMKLIKGDTLEDLLKARPHPAADRGRFVAAFEQVCQAVAYAHAHGVIHRDLKPGNVMIGSYGEVQVMDWGLAKVLGSRDPDVTDPDETTSPTAIHSIRETDSAFTQDGSVLGTPAYMPPEQAIGAIRNVDARSDVFGLGAVLAVILSGKPPFVGSSVQTTRLQAAQGNVEECFGRLDGCGAEPELVSLCRRCLSRKPDDRPADAGEVARAVAELRAAADERARQAELETVRVEGARQKAELQAAEQRKRRRVQLALVGLVVVLVAGAGGVAVWRVQDAADRRAEATRLEGEEKQRLGAERERQSRAVGACSGLLDQTAAALQSGDANRAATLLDQAARRAADERIPDHAARLAAYQTDLAMLRELDKVDAYRWTPNRTGPPSPQQVIERWTGVFSRFGLTPGDTPVAGIASRINASNIRGSMLAALHLWLSRVPSDSVQAVLEAADPHPFRSEVRRLLSARDRVGLEALVGRPEWDCQPIGLARAFANSPAIPAETSRAVLARLSGLHPDDFGLLMDLGSTYPINTPDWADARIRWYQAAVALRPRFAAAHLVLGVALRDKGDTEAAIAAFREAIRLIPTWATAHNNLGHALGDKGDTDEAFAVCREAIRLDPTIAEAHNFLGIRLWRNQDLDGAIAAFREAIRVDPKFTHAHRHMGYVLRDKGDVVAAAAAFREAIGLDPKHSFAHYDLGLTLRDTGDLDGAIAAFREAIRLDPKFAAAHRAMGVALQTKGNRDGALAAFREATRFDPKDAFSYHAVGRALFEKRDLSGAIAAFREATRLDPGSAIPHYDLGNALQTKGELKEAEAAYREAIRLNPRYTRAYLSLGNVNHNQGRLGEAATAYREAVRLDPGVAAAHYFLGNALREMGDAGGAEAAYREAVRLDGDRHGAAIDYLADLLAKESKIGEEVVIRQEIVRLKPTDPTSHINLGRTYRTLGRLDDAIASYRAAIAIDPSLVAAHDGLAYCERVRRGEVPTAPPPRPR